MTSVLSPGLRRVIADAGMRFWIGVAPLFVLGGWFVGRLWFSAGFMACTIFGRAAGVLWRARQPQAPLHP